MLEPTVTLPAPHLPTPELRREVELMAAIGLTTEQIAYVFRCSPSEVAQHYAQEYSNGLVATTAQVAGALVRQALAGDVPACKYWLEVRAKWKAPVQVEVRGVLDTDERRSLLDSILGIVAVQPEPEGKGPKAQALHLPAPGREQ